tara:strand:- start:2681 stop:2833 length:153 start_codon:yes stop_codon:yes gene_type:complete
MEIKLDEQELDYLTMVIEQNLEDYEEGYGELYNETLKGLYNKLILLTKTK